jgi:hypothetical protein
MNMRILACFLTLSSLALFRYAEGGNPKTFNHWLLTCNRPGLLPDAAGDEGAAVPEMLVENPLEDTHAKR